MNVMSMVAGADQFSRTDSIRRRNAEQAYAKQDKYVNRQDALQKLERLLLGETEAPKPKGKELQAGQMKQVHLPVGKTLEETIELWKNVRSDAYEEPIVEPIQQALGATPSAAIRTAEQEVALSNQTPTQFLWKQRSFPKPGSHWQALEAKNQYQQAIASYGFQVNMQKRGFEPVLPSISRVA